ncbi:MAG TPA: T9SS type A sorting domain-containing protein, partial [Bacteroidales bacterium]|nr:T9SS type A sorting domain-containing protein [Bacteroidales bacterium]
EGKFTWANLDTVSRLISPQINLSGLDSVTLMFSHYYNIFTLPAPVIGVATRHLGGGWTTVWEIQPDDNVGPETRVITIKNPDVGQPDFQFCFFIDGNLYNMNSWNLDDILLYTPPPKDLALISVNLQEYAVSGDSVLLSGKVKNLGKDTVHSFDVSCSVDGGAPEVYSISGISLALGSSFSFTDSLPLIFTAPGYHTVPARIENVNGGNDNNPANDTLSASIGIVPWKPGKKVFCEEATGTWCGSCVRGICYMDYMAQTYPDTWEAVSVHSLDPMENTAYEGAIGDIIPNFPGYPSGTLDRAGEIAWDPEDFEKGYLERIKFVSPGTVSLINFRYEPGTRTVDFDVESQMLIDVYHELRFCAVVSEDSVWGRTSGFDQANYYAGGGYGVMCGFENLPNPVPAVQMHYDQTAREILDTPYGTVGSLPVPVLAGNTYDHHYTLTIPSSWAYEKLKFIALLMDHTTGEILNATDQTVLLGIKETDPEFHVTVFPNPFSSDASLEFTLQQPMTAELRVLDLTGKVIFRGSPKQFPAGPNRIVLDGSQFHNGVYIAELLIGDKICTARISVMK